MRLKSLLAISATVMLSTSGLGAGEALASPGDAARDAVGGTGHLAVQTGRATVREGERIGHRGLQTGRATGHAVARGVRRITNRGHHHRRSYRG